jgi:tyrosyl-tRNA synthetase
MGKTEKGAVFLDPDLTSPYDFFQYWRNVSDADTRRFLLMFTFLSKNECVALTAPGKNPNEAKERLAYEVTTLSHGKDEAEKALSGAKAAFGGGGDRNAMPTERLARAQFEAGYNVVDLFFDAKLCATKSDARRLVEQGGAFVSDKGSELSAVTGVKDSVDYSRLDSAGELVLRAGKKRFCRIVTGSLNR